MRISHIRHIILFFSFLCLALFSSHPVQAETIIAASGKVSLVHASPQKPEAKMELIKQDVSSVGHNSIQKKIFTFASLPAVSNDYCHVDEEDLFIKNSLLLVKKHLLLIFPFHHFW